MFFPQSLWVWWCVLPLAFSQVWVTSIMLNESCKRCFHRGREYIRLFSFGKKLKTSPKKMHHIYKHTKNPLPALIFVEHSEHFLASTNKGQEFLPIKRCKRDCFYITLIALLGSLLTLVCTEGAKELWRKCK